MKKIITIAIFLTTLNVVAFPPTKEQIENAKKIEELRKTNKGGKNSKKIIELMNANALKKADEKYQSDLKKIEIWEQKEVEKTLGKDLKIKK